MTAIGLRKAYHIGIDDARTTKRNFICPIQ